MLRVSGRFCIGMSIVLIACAAGAVADYSQPGTYFAGWRTVTVTRSNNTTFTARLHYPATATGQNAPFDASGAPYAAVSFGHGFLQAVTQYQSTCAHLATWGFLVIASESEGGLFPSHSGFASDMSRCLTYLEQQNNEPGSDLHQAVDVSAFGMSGHSMGGGCSVLAAATDPRVRALANLAAAETNPSAVAAAANLRCAVSYISGSMDTITPVATNGQLMYNATLSPRQLPLIVGGFHCGFTDAGFPFCDTGGISRGQQLAITRRLLTEFFLTHLCGESQTWRAVWGPEATADPQVQRQIDANAVITPPPQTLELPGGRSQLAAITLTHTGPETESYRVFADGSNWTVEPPAEPVGPIAPGASREVWVRFEAPGGAAGSAQEVLISARAESDRATRCYGIVTVRRLPRVADMNCDGSINNFDIDGFVLALTDAEAYQSAYPQCDSLHADTNGDGVVNNFDIDFFVACIAAGDCG